MAAMTTIVIDGTEGLPDEQFYADIASRYWVLVFKRGHRHGDWTTETARPRDWLMSMGRPTDPPNGNMVWRRPTYGEMLDWCAWWNTGERPDDRLDSYRMPAGHNPRVCSCGHGEPSHRVGGQCRMQCDHYGFWPVES
jgi:hypothetical protein